MYVYINEQLRKKGEDHGEVLYWCGRPTAGGGGLGFCPRRCTVYTRRHFNVDPRFVYGMCVGGKFEKILKLHATARKWSEKDARALTDDRYRSGLLEQMMRQGLVNTSPQESEQRRELVKAAIEMMNGEDKLQLVGDLVKHKQSSDADNSSSSGGGNSNTDKTVEKTTPQRRSGRERTPRQDTRKQWNPLTKEYEQVIVKATATQSGRTRVEATIDICDTYSGTGTTIVAAGDIARDMGIRIAVTSICEIDMTLRDRLYRLWGRQIIKVFSDMDDITEGEIPPHHMMVASPPCQGFSTMGNGLGMNDMRSRSFPMIMQITTWCRPLIVLIEEVMGFLGWNGEGIFLPEGQQGRAFTDLTRACHGAGYRMFYFDIQLAHLGIPQYRKRLWCVPVRGDVHDAMGDYPTPQLEEEQMSPQIGAFLLQDESYYKTAAPIQSLIAVTAQVYYDFKPHLVGTVRLEGSEELNV